MPARVLDSSALISLELFLLLGILHPQNKSLKSSFLDSQWWSLTVIKFPFYVCICFFLFPASHFVSQSLYTA